MKTHAKAETIESPSARCLAITLIQLRQKHKLSIKSAAARLGVAESTWSQWETGKRFPPRHLIDHILSMFNIPPCLLFSCSINPAPLRACQSRITRPQQIHKM